MCTCIASRWVEGCNNRAQARSNDAAALALAAALATATAAATLAATVASTITTAASLTAAARPCAMRGSIAAA